MPQKRYRPEEIIAKLRQAEVLLGQAKRYPRLQGDRHQRGQLLPLAQGIRGPHVTQTKRLKDLERENAHLRRAISDLTLDPLILQEAALELPRPPRTDAGSSTQSVWMNRERGPSTVDRLQRSHRGSDVQRRPPRMFVRPFGPVAKATSTCTCWQRMGERRRTCSPSRPTRMPYACWRRPSPATGNPCGRPSSR